MAGELDGQVAIVTGGGRGIGRAIGLAFAAAGAAVTVAARSAEQVEETVALIRAAGGAAQAVVADVSDDAAVERMVTATERRFGPVDVLVNNAAVGGPIGPLWESDPTDWRRSLDINLVGPYLCCRAVLPGMVARGRGRIINVASPAAESVGGGYLSAYAPAKAALVKLSEGLAISLRPHGVQVFAISPGGVLTAMTRAVMDDDEQDKWLHYRAFPPELLSPPEQAADLCVRLATGAADALTGRFFGGFRAGWDDVDAMLRQAEAVAQDNLYTLRRRTLGELP